MYAPQIGAATSPPAGARAPSVRRSRRVADPDRGRQRRRVADEPGVGEVVDRAGLAGRGAADLRLGAGAALDVLLQDLGRLGGDAVLEGPVAARLPELAVDRPSGKQTLRIALTLLRQPLEAIVA